MPYVSNTNDKNFASAGVGTAGLTLGVIGTALASGFLNGGLGGVFGNGNPAANATYQLSQKDTEIAELKAERYADQQLNLVQLELSNVKQRLAAMEAAAPLREKLVGEQVGFIGATVNRLVQPMIPSSNVSYPQTTSTEESA